MNEETESSIKEQEANKEESKKFLSNIKNKSENLLPALRDLASGNFDEENKDNRETLANEIEFLLRDLHKTQSFLRSNGLAERIKHDLGNQGMLVLGNLDFLMNNLLSGKKDDIILRAKKFLDRWDRYWIVIEDLLLRKIDKKKVDKELVGSLDIDMLERLTGYFSKQEMEQIHSQSTGDNSQYREIKNKNFHSEIDFVKLKKDLEDK